jgi:hypothetical protein
VENPGRGLVVLAKQLPAGDEIALVAQVCAEGEVGVLERVGLLLAQLARV